MTTHLFASAFSVVMRLVLLLDKPEREKDIEILVLHQEIAVLRRQIPQPRTNSEERLVLSVLQQLRSATRRTSSLVTPDTLRRWHAELMKKKWHYPHRIVRRNAIPSKHNYSWGGWPKRTTRGATGVFTMNSRKSAYKSRPPASDEFSTNDLTAYRRLDRGARSFALKLHRSSPAISSLSRASPDEHFMFCSSLSSILARFTSLA